MTNVLERDRLVYELRGIFDEKSIAIYVRKDASHLLTSRKDLKRDAIAFLRSTGGDSYELSLMLFSGIPVPVRAFSRLSIAHEGSQAATLRVGSKTAKNDQVCMGKVKWFDNVRECGFISLDNEKDDVFLRASALRRSGISDIQKGQRVRAVIGIGRKGKEVRTIEVI